jgi:hypothetical protein
MTAALHRRHEGGRPLGIIAVHVETGAGRRQQHAIAAFRLGGQPAHGCLHVAGAPDRQPAAGERRLDLPGGAADQGDRPAMLLQRRQQRAEVLALAVAAEDDGHLAPEAFNRGQRRADVGALGVIDITDPGDLGDRFDPVRQAGKRLERREQTLRRDADGIAQGKRRQRIRDIVQTGQFQRVDRDQRLAALADARRRLSP